MSNSSNLIFEVIQLRAEVKLLRAEVRDVRTGLMCESDSTTQSIKKICDTLVEVQDRVDPLWRRIFPETAGDDNGDDAASRSPD